MYIVTFHHWCIADILWQETLTKVHNVNNTITKWFIICFLNLVNSIQVPSPQYDMNAAWCKPAHTHHLLSDKVPARPSAQTPSFFSVCLHSKGKEAPPG